MRSIPDAGGREDGVGAHLGDRQELRSGRPRPPARERRSPGQGHRHQGRRQDRPFDQGPPGPRAQPAAPRRRPGLRGPPEEVHAPERGAPGGLQALRRAQAQVAPPVGERRGSDLRIVAEQLGREPTVPFTVVARCPDGHPLVIRNAPVDPDGNPFPTTFWLTCPVAVKAVSRLEADGWISRLNERIETDPAFAEAVARAHVEYARERARDLAGAEGWGGVGGTRTGLKCLHAHYANRVAGGDDAVGAWVAERIEPVHDEPPGRGAAGDPGARA